TQNSKLKTQNYLYLFAFTLGLSFTHHMQTVYLVPASIFFIIAVCYKYKKLSPLSLSSLLNMFCLFIIPLFLYLYLPICASTHPVHNWGDPSTFERLIAHLTAEEYRERYFTSTQLLQRLVRHAITYFPLQFSSYFVISGLIGLIFCLLKQRLFFIFLFLIYSADAFYSIHYTILNIEDYYIPSYMIMSIWIGCGFIEISKLIFKFSPNYIYLLYVIILILCPIFLFKFHYFQNDKSKYYLAYDYGRNIINQLEEKSIIFLRGDAVFFPYWYLQYVDGQRKDLISIFRPYLDKEWHFEEIKRKYPELSLGKTKLFPKDDEQLRQARMDEIITWQIDFYPIYALMDESLPSGFSKIPAGIFDRVIKSEKESILSQNIKEVRFNLRGINDKRIYQQDWRTKDEIISNYASIYNNFGLFYSQKGKVRSAIREFKKAIEVSPNDALLHENLGRAYININNIDLSIIEFQKASKLDINNISLHCDLGNLYAQKGRYKEAIAEFQKTIKLDSNNIKAHQNLASVYYNQGEYLKAEKECNLILTINPENTYIKQVLQAISSKIKGGCNK
ncbi:MAG: tetratricopeptide repeat protein, partial [bacterium]